MALLSPVIYSSPRDENDPRCMVPSFLQLTRQFRLTLVNARPSCEHVTMPQLRQNIITGDWVVIAPERSKRPNDFIVAESTKPSAKLADPFALGGEVYQHRLGHLYETDRIYTIPNSFPAFVEDPDNCSHRTYELEDFYRARPSTGGHDVVIIKEADQTIYDFPTETWQQLFEVVQRRYQYWRRDCNTEHTMLIYNHGARAGASIAHPHAQIFASNIVPNAISREITGAQEYFTNNGRSVFEDLLQHERKQRHRIIAENDEFLVFTFYAARFPFEAWVMPKENIGHFEAERPAFIHSLAGLMKKVMAMYDRVLARPHLNFFLHDLPKSIGEAEFYRWHIEITPRLGTYGGYELGSGVVIDVMSPEDAAEFMRSS